MNRAEEKSMAVAEAAREKVWRGRSILKDIFLGDFELSLVHPYPGEEPERPEFVAFYQALERFLFTEVDPDRIDREGEYPPEVLDGLRRLGAFGMKIKKAYGGLELSQVEYARVMELLGSHDANLVGLLSAHQSIGVPQPVQLFGSDDLKKRYLPRCAQGAISAFALTEPNVGSDPASLSTTARLSADGTHYVLDGVKLWCTNGTLAELLVVMAKDPVTDKISAFVVETDWEGVKVEYRCRFMGLRALSNAVLSFNGVKVPRENLIGKEGAGLKIALTTLNAGRLSIPASCVGAAKRCVEITRKWAGARSQWGQEIGKHEAVALRISDMAATTFAMECVSDLCQVLAQTEGVDIRLEAAMAKEWCAQQAWRIVDDALQIRGGRGYETEQSLKERGEVGLSIERMMRDARVNTIFEGSSEVMHLFMAREAVDAHLKVAGPLVLGKGPLEERAKALPGIAAFYAKWYPSRWFTLSGYTGYSEFGDLAQHLRFVDRTSKKIARETFHGMVRYQAGLAKRQGFLFRIVDAGMELFAMAAVCGRVMRMRQDAHPRAVEAGHLARIFCAAATRKVERLLEDLWRNEDSLRYSTGRAVLTGNAQFLEEGALPTGVSTEEFKPRNVVAPAERKPAAARAKLAEAGNGVHLPH